MTQQKAIKRARELAKTTGRAWYVVHDTTADVEPARAYFPADDEELDTYYGGTAPLYCTEDD